MEIRPGPEVWEPDDAPSDGAFPELFAAAAPDFRAGFVAVVGRPNVGKSTLINEVVGQKISIVSDKPQTTRARLLGILHRTNAQIVFVDTPGIHRPTHRLGEYMVAAARQSLEDADLIAFMVDLAGMPHDEDRVAADTVFKSGTKAPVVLVGNKLDIVRNTSPESALDRFGGLGEFADRSAVSATTGDGVDALLDLFERHLPLSPPFYPPDQITDQPERVVAAELIREAVLRHTHQEIPHAIAVVVEEFKERGEGGIIDVQANLYVERESQKGIVIGKGGAMLKTIGADARAEIEAMVGARVFLQLWVKVREQWRKKDPNLRQLGYSMPGRGRG